jgi:RNA polymerase sigma factor (sigma-70 family)
MKGRPGSAPPIRQVTDTEVARHLPLVHYTLQRMQRRGQLALTDVDYEDLEAIGRWAVWEALRRWSPAKGAQSTYLSSYIFGYVLRHQRDMTKANGWHRTDGRIATIQSLDAPISPDDQRTLADVLVLDQDPEPSSDTLEHLTDVAARMPRQRRLIAERILADQPVSHAADELGVSRQRVSQIAQRVRADLADALAQAA